MPAKSLTLLNSSGNRTAIDVVTNAAMTVKELLEAQRIAYDVQSVTVNGEMLNEGHLGMTVSDVLNMPNVNENAFIVSIEPQESAK